MITSHRSVEQHHVKNIPMPRIRPRKIIISRLEKLVESRDRHAEPRNVVFGNDIVVTVSEEDSIIANDFEETLINHLCKDALDDTSSNRYLFRPQKYCNRSDVFNIDDCLS